MSSEQPDPTGFDSGFDTGADDEDVLALLGHDGAALPTTLELDSW